MTRPWLGKERKLWECKWRYARVYGLLKRKHVACILKRFVLCDDSICLGNKLMCHTKPSESSSSTKSDIIIWLQSPQWRYMIFSKIFKSNTSCCYDSTISSSGNILDVLCTISYTFAKNLYLVSLATLGSPEFKIKAFWVWTMFLWTWVMNEPLLI